jgi:peptide deformylase
MARLQLRKYDDPILRKQTASIEEITPEIEQLAHDMIETMCASNGVGLAAPQIGQLLKIFIIRDEFENEKGEYDLKEPEVMINPTLSNPSKERTSRLEGCLSLPGLFVNVVRPKQIHIRYMNLKGEFVEEVLDEFRARVAMHENDHLNGTLTIDRINKKERKSVEPKLLAIRKKYASIGKSS